MEKQVVQTGGDLSIDDEILIQDELKKCKNSFQRKNIVSKKLIEGKHRKVNMFEYNGNDYNLQPYESADKVQKRGSKIYVPVFVLNFQKLQLTFSPGWFVDENSARNKLKSVDSFLCLLSDSELKVLKENNRISNYINKKLSNKKDLLNNINLFLLWSIPIFMYLLIFGKLIGGDFLSIIISNILAIIPVLFIFSIRRSLNKNIESFYEIEGIEIDNSYHYNIINADVDITPTEVKFYSEELDCTWVFEKDDVHILPDECMNLLNNTDGDNNIIISVSKSLSDDSIIKSENDEWWIESLN